MIGGDAAIGSAQAAVGDDGSIQGSLGLGGGGGAAGGVIGCIQYMKCF